MALVPAHLAPMDIHFYTGDLFPAQYHNAAFVALRGGQTGGNLARVPGFKVISLHSEPDGSGARLADFMTGFGTDPQGSSVWGKPVGIASDRFGHLYVTSDYRMDAVFRIEPGPLLGTLEHNLPDTLSNASVLPLSATVRLSRFSDTGKSPTLTADLSPYGGSAREPFTEVEAGLYRLDRSLEIEGDVGARPLVVKAEQSIDGETEVLEFRRQFVILPAFDIEILTGSLTPGWKVEATSGAHVLDQDGDPGEAFQVTAEGFGATWSVAFDTAEPADALGYSGLRFAFRAQDLDIPPVPQFVVILNGLKLDLARGPEPYRLDFARQDWQILEIPLKEFTHVTSNGGANATVVTDKVDRIDAIRFEGNVTGTIHLDSMRVVTEGRPTVLPSLVREAQVGSRPTRFALEQNYPNPFNPETTIRFHLPRSQQIELAIYNLGAQRVATLVQGHREAGSYSVRWDGLDDAGLELASGVYFYRLTAGERVETKKLLLLR